jgi:type I restriction enzyme, S subunit
VSCGNNNLPETWVKVRLADIVKPTRPKHSPQDFPTLQFIGMENVEAHSMKLLGTVPASSMRSNAVHFQPGDVLYGRLRPYLNKVYCPNFEGLCSAEFIVFPPRDWIESKFLQYFLNSSGFVSFATHLNAGDRPRVDFDQIGAYQIPLVPVHEQKRIVAEIEKQFTRLDASVAALKRVQANLKRYRAAVLKAACEGRLVPTEAELARREGRSYEPASVLLERILVDRRSRWESSQLAKSRASGRNPENDDWKKKYDPPENLGNELDRVTCESWVWATVDQLTIGDRTCSYGVLQPGDDVADGVLFIRVGDINNGRVATTGIKRIAPQIADQYPRTSLRGGEVLITLVGAIGRTAVVPESLAGANTARAVGVIPVTKLITARWLELWLRNPQKVNELTGQAHEVARKTLNLEDVRRASVALPPVNEQDRIVGEVERRLSVVDEVEAEVGAGLKRADRLRQAILKIAFEGKLVPQDPNDKPADALLERIRGTATLGCAPGKQK